MNILSGWEDFVTQRDDALTVVKTLLCEIILRFRLPYQLSQMVHLPLASSIAQGVSKH